mmetsp:Transcript_4778/g.4915  ORF Transcript_4778/g.4915 Transcript_4778/m.4915 type:complete len:119 (-) Transcript_4778:116-472(-)
MTGSCSAICSSICNSFSNNRDTNQDSLYPLTEMRSNTSEAMFPVMEMSTNFTDDDSNNSKEDRMNGVLDMIIPLLNGLIFFIEENIGILILIAIICLVLTHCQSRRRQQYPGGVYGRV